MYKNQQDANRELPKLINLFKSNVNHTSLYCLQNDDEPRLWLGLTRTSEKSKWTNTYDSTVMVSNSIFILHAVNMLIS